MKRTLSRFFLLSFLLIANVVHAQQLLIPLEKSIIDLYDRHTHKKEALFHTSIKPYLQSEMDSVVAFNEVWPFAIPDRPADASFGQRFWYSIRYDDIVPIRKDQFYLAINPLMNFSVGYEIDEAKVTYQNTRAAGIKGSIGSKFAFESRFYENQAKFPQYLDQYIRNDTVVPGQGRPRVFKSGAYDFAWADAYLSYSPNEIFNLQFGHGKNFIGDGYRSLFLSDNSFNYPFLKLTVNVWRIKYMVLYAEMLDIDFASKNFTTGFPKKYATIHYLSWDIKSRFQFGLFESIIWGGQDSTQRRGIELQYLNPIIFLRPVEFSLGSPDNASLGFFANFKASDHVFLYTQIMVDDLDINKSRQGSGFFRNKVAFQGGIKIYDLFDVDHLFFQTEYNLARPYTYGHKIPLQNYSHFNQALAHPLGANFHESITFLNYRFGRFFAGTKWQYARFGMDAPEAHNGKNIFLSDFDIPGYPNSYGNKIGQGIPTNLIQGDIRFQFVVNPKINLNFEVKYTNRLLSNAFQKDKTSWLSFTLKTGLNNFYYDF